MAKKVVSVILNWNAPADTLECIESCQHLTYENHQLLVIDNHSDDNSVQLIKEKFPSLEVIVCQENFGYAGGNNVGMREALARKADFVFLLNNDLTLEPNVVDELVHAFELNPKAGMAAPKVMYYDDRSTINSMGTAMDWLRLRPYLGFCNQIDTGQFRNVMQRDILVGCALMVRRETLEQIGLIDERFFIFHEEADWCFRHKKSGGENIVVPGAVVYHKASKTMRKFSRLTHYYSTRNFLLLTKKNASLTNKLKVLIGVSYLSVKNLFLFVIGNEDKRSMARAFFLGIYDYFTNRFGKCRRNLR